MFFSSNSWIIILLLLFFLLRSYRKIPYCDVLFININNKIECDFINSVLSRTRAKLVEKQHVCLPLKLRGEKEQFMIDTLLF